MYSQANVRAGECAAAPSPSLPSVIVDTEKVLREADGPEESDFHQKKSAWVERCSPRFASDGESREEPEEHKRNEKWSMVTFRRNHLFAVFQDFEVPEIASIERT